MIVCHFEGKLTLAIDTICCSFVVFVKHRERMIRPIEVAQDMERLLILVEVFVSLEYVGAMDTELVHFGYINLVLRSFRDRS